jgi:hypothetical protein
MIKSEDATLSQRRCVVFSLSLTPHAKKTHHPHEVSNTHRFLHLPNKCQTQQTRRLRLRHVPKNGHLEQADWRASDSNTKTDIMQTGYDKVTHAQLTESPGKAMLIRRTLKLSNCAAHRHEQLPEPSARSRDQFVRRFYVYWNNGCTIKLQLVRLRFLMSSAQHTSTFNVPSSTC